MPSFPGCSSSILSPFTVQSTNQRLSATTTLRHFETPISRNWVNRMIYYRIRRSIRPCVPRASQVKKEKNNTSSPELQEGNPRERPSNRVLTLHSEFLHLFPPELMSGRANNILISMAQALVWPADNYWPSRLS